MKKHSLFLIIALAFVLLFQAGCSKSEQANTTNWEQMIRTDFFSGESNVEKEIAKVVSIKVKQDGDQLFVTAKAPNICDRLLNWMDSVSDEDFTEVAMEEEILHLLKESEKVATDYVLICSGEGETANIVYTSEFGEALTCGLTQFYAKVTQQVQEEMGDNIE